MGGVTAGHLGRCTRFIRGASSTPRHQLASLQYWASGADCVAAPSRDLREQAWVRAFLVNSGSRHGGSSGRVVPTPTTVRMTHINAHWYCCCKTVTKQQETSHTDHWHCIVIEIWVSFASPLFPCSLSLSFSIVSALTAEHDLLCRFLFLHLLLLCNISSFFWKALQSALHPSSSTTESSQTLLAPSSLLFMPSSGSPLVLCARSPELHSPPLSRRLTCASLLSHATFHPPTTYSSIFSGLTLHRESWKQKRTIFHKQFASLFSGGAAVVIINNHQRHRAASFCVSTPMFVAACWQRRQISDPPMRRAMEEVNQSEHTVTRWIQEERCVTNKLENMDKYISIY